MHALIIEDESMFAEIIEYVLKDCGFDTFDIAGSSARAIEAAAQRRPDLITADVILDPGSGIEAVRIIGPGPSTPVIFITARAAADVRVEMSRCMVLQKPFSEQTLTYAVSASMLQ